MKQNRVIDKKLSKDEQNAKLMSNQKKNSTLYKTLSEGKKFRSLLLIMWNIYLINQMN